MKHFDYIIKYLSGELSPGESLVFEKELVENPQLKEEYSRVSRAYRMIGDQLRKKDEEAFGIALKSAMGKTAENSWRHKKPGRLWYVILGMAASLTILFSIFRHVPDTERIYSRYFNPSEDKLISIILEETRGEAGRDASKLWQIGEYEECQKLCRAYLSEDPENQYNMLFCLLSFLEIEEKGPVPQWLTNINHNSTSHLGQAITWYHSLALVKADLKTDAALLLSSLEGLPGPYSKDAHKLKKILTK